MSEIRVLLADERKLFRQGLICLFTKELGILVAGDTGDGLEAEKMVQKKKPDVLVLNVRLPSLDGISIAQRISKLSDPPRIVFLSERHNEMHMREALHAGAQAYLLQDCDFKELVFAIRKVATGDYYLTGPAGRQLVMEYVSPGEGGADAPGLMTRRELEICRLLSDGYSTKEVADRLNISVKTAETHRATIMKKLHAKNVTDIVKYCIRNKIIEP
jgi:DNA-binding NarL/FixJ family response regulator